MKEPMLESEDLSLLLFWGILVAVVAGVDAIFRRTPVVVLSYLWLLTVLALTGYLVVRRYAVRTVNRYVEGVSQRILTATQESHRRSREELSEELRGVRQEVLDELKELREQVEEIRQIPYEES